MDRNIAALALRDAMRSRGLSISQLAREADLDRSTVRKLLEGDGSTMQTAKLGRIEQALGWPPGYLDRIGHADLDVPDHDLADLHQILTEIDEVAAAVGHLRLRVAGLVRRNGQ